MALPTMAEELEKFKSSPHYERCKELLNPDFIDRIVDADSAQHASRCIHSGQTLLGPRDPLFRKAIGEIAKTVDKTITKKLLPARDFDQRLDGLAAAWLEVLEMIRPHLPLKTWEQLSPKLEWVFSKARMRDGLTK